MQRRFVADPRRAAPSTRTRPAKPPVPANPPSGTRCRRRRSVTLTELVTLLLVAHAGGASGAGSGGATPMSADKIGAQHRARKAVLYVRQSSAHQVQHNRESQVLQYAMRDRLVQLGWSRDRGHRRGPWLLGGRRDHARRLRAHGRRGLPRQGRRGGGAGGLALRAQQPRLAAAGRDVPRGRHAADRSGGRLRAAPRQRPAAARA